MKHTHDVLRDRILLRLGIEKSKQFKIEDLRKSEWSNEFETFMRNRLIMGAFRYGLITESKKTWDRIGYMERKIEAYRKTGNTEALVDIANLCMLEYMESDKGKFRALDNTNEHQGVKG